MSGRNVEGPLLQLTREIRTLVKQAAEHVLAIGSRLIQVKDYLSEHPEQGTFHDWLEKEFDWSMRTARNFMRVSLSFKPHTGKICQLSPSVLYLLSSPSVTDETREEAIDLAAAGDNITNAKARELIEERRSIEESLRGLSEEDKLALLQKAEEEDGGDEDDDPPEPKTPLEKYQATWTKQAKYDKQFLSSPKSARIAENLRAKYESHVKYDLGKK